LFSRQYPRSPLRFGAPPFSWAWLWKFSLDGQDLARNHLVKKKEHVSAVPRHRTIVTRLWHDEAASFCEWEWLTESQRGFV
jgi:hypothetical protein